MRKNEYFLQTCKLLRIQSNASRMRSIIRSLLSSGKKCLTALAKQKGGLIRHLFLLSI